MKSFFLAFVAFISGIIGADTLPPVEETILPEPDTVAVTEPAIIKDPLHMSLEEVLVMAQNAIEHRPEYQKSHGTNLKNVDTTYYRCPSCWDFLFEFDVPKKDESHTVLVGVREGVIESMEFSEPNEKIHPFNSESMHMEGPLFMPIETVQHMVESEIKYSPEYQSLGTNLQLNSTITYKCPSCWDFVYLFDSLGENEPRTVTVGVREGTIQSIEFSPLKNTVILNEALPTISLEAAQKMAEDAIKEAPQYKTSGGTHLELISVTPYQCLGCWKFLFEFRNQGANAEVLGVTHALVEVLEGKIETMKFSGGITAEDLE